jgi:hypothetical protein
MKRRKFLETAGYSAVATIMVPQLRGNQTGVQAANVLSVSQDNQASVIVKDSKEC